MKTDNLKHSSQGGCWYCHKVDSKLLYSEDKNTNVHQRCIEMKLDENDEEALEFAKEFNIRNLRDDQYERGNLSRNK